MCRPTLWLALLAAVSPVQVEPFGFPSNCTERHSEVRYLVQYKPFIFCGRVTAITPPLEQFASGESVAFDSKICLIGCVNRTLRAVGIEIYNCDTRIDTAGTSSNYDQLEYADCHSDEEYILWGLDRGNWTQFTMQPDIGCLRSKLRSSCGRIFRSLKRDQFYEDVEVGTLSLGLNRSIWAPYGDNGGSGFRASLAISMVLLLLPVTKGYFMN